MGCLCVSNSNSSAPTVDRDDEKLTMLPKNRKIKKYKLLLLGPGESGKSTFARQLRKLYGQDFTQSQLLAIKPYIIDNIITSMRTLAVYSEILHDLNEGYDTKVDEQNEEIRSRIARIKGQEVFTKEDCDDFKTLWNDIHIRNLVKLSYKFQLSDTCEYFFERMDNYWKDEYVPTFDDLIHTRQRTSGVNKTRVIFDDKKAPSAELYDIWDAGGQKMERKKWHHFRGATAVIYVVALSGYNQGVWEETGTNRMKEAMNLFGGLVSMDLFANIHGIVFLNKADLFYKKVGVYSVREYFTDYTGSDDNAEQIIDFFKEKFMIQWNKKTNKKRPQIHFHITCATDTECIQKIFESVRFIVVKESLRNNGFL